MEIGLADSIIGKIFLAHHRSHLLEKRSNSNLSFSRSKGVVRTDNYILTVKEKKIHLSDTELLNDNIMDPAQKVICKALRRLESHQSVLNWQKRRTLFFNISEEYIQLMHSGTNHWLVI